MTEYKIGSICLYNNNEKTRPFIIINNGLGVDLDITALVVTTRKPRNRFDVELKHWKEAGLSKPSIARTSKLHTIIPGESLVLIGKLQKEDFIEVSNKVKEYISEGIKAFEP